MDGGGFQVLAGGEVILESLMQGGAPDCLRLALGHGVLAGRDLAQQLHGFLAGLFDGQVAVAAQGDALDLAVSALFRDEGFRPATGDAQAKTGDGAIPVKGLGGLAVSIPVPGTIFTLS